MSRFGLDRKKLEAASRARLADLEKELGELNEELSRLRAQWEKEKKVIEGARTIQKRLDDLRIELEQAKTKGEYERASRLEYGEIPALEKQLVAAFPRESAMLRLEVGEADIAAIVSRWTGIPMNRILEGEVEKLLKMEARLRERVVGQDPALTAIADALRRNRAGLDDPKRPIGSFLFLGPTGVGKTEVARALAEFLFDDENALVRIDMSEFTHEADATRLIGAAPGYVGYEEGGRLTEAIRRRPYAVILLDEMEKAHPRTFDIFLQVLEDGRLTDGQGRTVDFRNTVVLMTTNLGSQAIFDAGGDPSKAEAAVQAALHAHFRPEFLNRLDEVVIFRSLSREDMVFVARIQPKRVETLLQAQRLALEAPEAALDWLASEGFDPSTGPAPSSVSSSRSSSIPSPAWSSMATSSRADWPACPSGMGSSWWRLRPFSNRRSRIRNLPRTHSGPMRVAYPEFACPSPPPSPSSSWTTRRTFETCSWRPWRTRAMPRWGRTAGPRPWRVCGSSISP